MEIEEQQNSVRHNDLAHGDPFRYRGKVCMRINKQGTAVNLDTGELFPLGELEKVNRLNIKVVIL